MLYAKAVMEVVFSAHAEVVPLKTAWDEVMAGILRARGGSSSMVGGSGAWVTYSPRTRR